MTRFRIRVAPVRLAVPLLALAVAACAKNSSTTQPAPSADRWEPTATTLAIGEVEVSVKGVEEMSANDGQAQAGLFAIRVPF